MGLRVILGVFALLTVTTEAFPTSNGTEEGQVGTMLSGGELGGLGQLPHIAVIIRPLLGTHRPVCSGTILSKRTVITSAYCYKKSSGKVKLQVRVGEHDRSNHKRDKAYDHKIKSVLIHPNYDEKSRTADLAIITLDSDIENLPRIHPVKYAAPAIGEIAGYEGTTGGWGALKDGDTTRPNRLRVLKVPILTNPQCQQLIGSSFTVRSDHLCTSANNGKGICSGDGGAPLTIVHNGVTVLVGVASRHDGCGRVPDIYTRVTSYTPWITANIVN